MQWFTRVGHLNVDLLTSLGKGGGGGGGRGGS